MLMIENNLFKAQFIEEGAQLVSFINKADGCEYIHDGVTGWGQHNPTLFPIVGKLKDNSTKIANQTHVLNQHGVVRRATFEVVEMKDNYISFKFSSDENTLKAYPFKFTMIKSYELKDNELIISHRVYNENDIVMPFTIGHHPAFKCPINNDEKFEDYCIRFECNESLRQRLINLDLGLFTNKEYDCVDVVGDKVSLPLELEKYGTIVFENLKSSFVHLVGPKHSVAVSNVGYPYFALWHTDTNNFVCLEPWLSHSDVIDTDGVFENKVGMLMLEPNKSFLNTYSIRFE